MMGRCWSEFLLPLYLGLGLGPMFKDDPTMKEAVFTTSVACYYEKFAVLVATDQHGQDGYFTYSYSPIYQDGRILGRPRHD